MKKFRVLSDLHMDINHDYKFDIADKDVFTVIAGDTSGEYAIVEPKHDNKEISVKIKNVRKFVSYFNERKRFKIIYTNGKWTFNGNEIDFSESNLELGKVGIVKFDENYNEIKTNDHLKEGDSVSFIVSYPNKWIEKNIKNGIIVAGNHLVYNRDHYSIEELKSMLHKRYPENGNITFLDNSVGLMAKEVDGILFIGSTLYTDYLLPISDSYRYGKESVLSDEKTREMNMRMATPKMSGGGLNDFNFGRTDECTYNRAFSLQSDDELAYITPQNYLNFFNRTFEEIKKIVGSNKDKDIVIVTHHCPSPKCISDKYVEDRLNASYVSNLEKFIEDNKNIKCWVCGHVHHRDSFKIGNCLIVMNPLGYCKYGQYRKGDESAEDWTPNVFVNTEKWEIETEPFDNSKWNKKYDSHTKRMQRYYKNFGAFFF